MAQLVGKDDQQRTGDADTDRHAAEERARHIAELRRRNQGLQLALTDLCAQLEVAFGDLADVGRRHAAELATATRAHDAYRVRAEARLRSLELARARLGKLEQLASAPARFTEDARKLRKLVWATVGSVADAKFIDCVGALRGSPPGTTR